MKIEVTTEEMRSKSNDILATLDTLRENMNQIELFVAGLSGDWQGDAEKAYAAKITYVSREFRELENFFNDIAGLLSEFADDYDRHEDELKSKISFI